MRTIYPQSKLINCKKQLKTATLVLLLFPFSVCNAPEQAAVMISKKVCDKVKKLNFSKSLSIKACLPEIDRAAFSPSISDNFIEKTELITTW